MAIARLEDRLRLMIFMDSFPRVADSLLPVRSDTFLKIKFIFVKISVSVFVLNKQLIKSFLFCSQ